MNPYDKKRFLSFLSFLIVLIIAVNLMVYLKLPYLEYMAMASSLLLILSFVLNLVFGRILYKRFANTKIKQQREILGQFKNEAEKNIKGIIKRMKLILYACWAAYILSFILCFVSISSFDALFEFEKLPKPVLTIIGVASIALSFSLLMGLFDMWGEKGKQPLPENELLEKDYPKLFEIVKEAASIVGAGKNIRIFLGYNNVGVFKYGKYDCILVGDIPMNILTREEMKQTLIHEFAHVYNENTLLTNKLSIASDIWQTETDNKFLSFTRTLMRIPAFFFHREFFFYTLCAKRVQEIEADNIVKKLGDRQVYINSLAKHAALSLFEETPCPEWSIHIYESEEPLDNYGDIYLELFYKYLDKNETLWRRIMDNELTPFLDSHPTFKARRESMGVCDYSFHEKETDEDYIKEQRKLLDLRNELNRENIKESYKEVRDYVYVKRFEAIEKYEKNPDQSVQDLIETALYYEGIDTEKAKEILKSILEQDSDNAYAYYHLGRILLTEFDKQGIDYIYNAIKRNDNFAGDGLNMIGHFCIKAGLQEELEEYRRNLVDMGQKAIDKNRAITSLSKNDKIVPHDLDSLTLDEILEFMVSSADGKLEKIILVKKVIDDYYSYIFMLKQASGVSDDEFSEVYYKLFTYLDLREEQFTLHIIADESKLKWLFNRVKNCVVWSKDN